MQMFFSNITNLLQNVSDLFYLYHYRSEMYDHIRTSEESL